MQSKDEKNLSDSAVSTKQVTKPSYSGGALSIFKSVGGLAWGGMRSIGEVTYDLIRNPSSIPSKAQYVWSLTVETAHHYYVGTKLLWSEIKLTYRILVRVLNGHGMTRRERIQLIRTTTDMFRLVPFAVFVIVPFMEFLLPFALKLFPNMLPSTFQDNLKKEEHLKQELQMRLAVAGFMQETLQSMVEAKKKNTKSETEAASASEVIDVIEKARSGDKLPLEQVIRIAKLFKDELTLDNMDRPQLVSMCQFMGVAPYGNETFLRFQLRNRMRSIKEDDRRILWEGIDQLTVQELRDACRERGMRAIGLSAFGYKVLLQEWLDLSIQRSVPISLLVISRAFSLSFVPTETILRNSLSSLDDDVVNEVVLEAARPEELSTVEMRQRKLDSLERAEEMIEDDQKAKEEAEATAAEKPTTVVDKEGYVSELPEEVVGDSLIVAEIQALGDMASGSAVSREKEELALLKTKLPVADINPFAETSFASTTSDIIKSNSYDKAVTLTSSAAADEQPEVLNLKKALDKMLGKLEVRIQKTELELGDKLQRLDLDGDGVVNAHELRKVLLGMLKRYPSLESADELISLLDRDQDGQVTVAELMEFVKAHAEKAKQQ